MEKVYLVKLRWYLSLLVVSSSSKNVMKEFRATGITVKVDYITKDEKYVFAENFVIQSLENIFHDGRRL